MSFIWSPLLYLLLCVPLLVLLYVRNQRRKREIAARLGSLGLLRDSSTGKTPGRLQLPALLFLIGISILLFSLARPQATVSLPKREGTVILAFDVSGSMSAEDLQPTRMEAAKAAAREFVENQPASVRVGVVAFSDGGIAVQSPTNRRDETLAAIDRLVPRRGTSIGNGIFVSLNTIAVDAGDPPFLGANNLPSSSESQPEPSSQPEVAPQGWYPSAVILLLTDGENNQEPDPILAADLAADFGVRIYTVGIGSPEGTIITVEGFTVHSRLDESMLQAIADTTGGVYYNAGNEDELRRIYNDLEPKMTVRSEEMEITAILSGLGILLFLVGGAISLLWFGRVL